MAQNEQKHESSFEKVAEGCTHIPAINATSPVVTSVSVFVRGVGGEPRYCSPVPQRLVSSCPSQFTKCSASSDKVFSR